MSKTSELSHAVDELKRCGETLIGIAEILRELFSTTDTAEEQLTIADTPTAVETKTYTLSEVRAVLAEKSRSGYTAEVRQLLLKYGAEKLSEIKETDYAALLKDAEVIGNA